MKLRLSEKVDAKTEVVVERNVPADWPVRKRIAMLKGADKCLRDRVRAFKKRNEPPLEEVAP